MRLLPVLATTVTLTFVGLAVYLLGEGQPVPGMSDLSAQVQEPLQTSAWVRVLPQTVGGANGVCRRGEVVYEIAARSPIVSIDALLDPCVDPASMQIYSGSGTYICETESPQRGATPLRCRRESVSIDSSLIPLTFSVRLKPICEQPRVSQQAIVTTLAEMIGTQPRLETVKTNEVTTTIGDCDAPLPVSSASASSATRIIRTSSSSTPEQAATASSARSSIATASSRASIAAIAFDAGLSTSSRAGDLHAGAPITPTGPLTASGPAAVAIMAAGAAAGYAWMRRRMV